MLAAKIAGLLTGILLCLAGVYLLRLSQTPVTTMESFSTTIWTSEAGPIFLKALEIPPGENRSLVLQASGPIHMGDWVQVGFTVTEGTVDVLVRDHDGETIRHMSDVSGRVKVAFFAPKESLYYLVLRNAKSNTSTAVLDFYETMYSLTTPLLTRRIDVVPRPLPVAASLMVFVLGVAAAVLGLRYIGSREVA